MILSRRRSLSKFFRAKKSQKAIPVGIRLAQYAAQPLIGRLHPGGPGSAVMCVRGDRVHKAVLQPAIQLPALKESALQHGGGIDLTADAVLLLQAGQRTAAGKAGVALNVRQQHPVAAAATSGTNSSSTQSVPPSVTRLCSAAA